MQTALLELQKALFARLTSNAELMEVVKGVYDYVPEQTSFPYVSLGEVTNTAFDSKTSIGENIVWPIHTWSMYRGKAESYQIINLILAALKEPLPIGGGFSMQSMQPLRPIVIKDAVSSAYHGIQEIRFYINN